MLSAGDIELMRTSSNELGADGRTEKMQSLLLIKAAVKVVASPFGVWLGIALAIGLAAANLNFIAADASSLHAIAQTCRAVGDLLLALPLFSLARVTPAGAQMAKLGFGSAKITPTALLGLQRWHACLLVCSVFAVLGWYGMYNLVWVGVLGNEDPNYQDYHYPEGETSLTAQQRLHAAILGCFSCYVTPLVFAWWLSLKQATVLACDQVLACRALIESISTSSADWNAEVLPQVLKLINVTLPTLSKGWGAELLGVWAGVWVTALGIFAKYLDGNNVGDLLLFVAAACFPFGLARDVAIASSKCETLKTSLNEKRGADPSVETHAKLAVVESLLQNQNLGQGLGFVVAGHVLDETTLKGIFAAMIGLLTTFMPLVIALARAQDAWQFTAGTGRCAMSTQQISTIQSAMIGRNASCAYVMSLDDILGM